MKSSKKEFIAEGEELLDESQRLILEIQDTFSTGVNPDIINALFRAMHTLKGVSGLFGLQGITDLSHALETLMDDVRLGRIDVDDGIVNFLFKNLDILKHLVEAVSEDKEEDVSTYLKDIESFRASLKSQSEGVSSEGLIDESILKVLSEYEEHRLKANIKDGKGIYIAKTVFTLDVFDKSLQELTGIIKTKGELISTLPTSSDVPEGSIGFNLMFGSAKSIDEVKQDINFDIDTLIQSKTAPQAVSTTQKPQEIALKKSTTTTVRVDIEKIDRILNTIGELTLAKGAVKRIGLELVEKYGHSPLVYDVNKISQTLEKRFSELKDQVLEIRMVPIGQIFTRLSQIVRRYSREIDKQIELAMYGEDTEIDKYLAEEIIDPLMHIIRNSIDHGIESPEERKEKGKNESGKIKVRKKAVEKGLIDDDVELNEKEIIDLIFTPGFSTKDVANEVSGRGVGMDVVKEKLSFLNGFAEIKTKKGIGTTFMLTLPITLAIIKALIVRVGHEKFAVPLTSMSETLIVAHKDIQTIEWKVGLLVDELFGQQEIVIKSLGDYFKKLLGFAGAAEIGKHEVILVLDIESIISESVIKQKGEAYV
jgi:two-component system chemotaxis sensor kinase CheA